MVNRITDRVARVGDRMLAKLVPNVPASAVCGNVTICCFFDPGNPFKLRAGIRRVDPEHGGICINCQPLPWYCN